MAGTFHFVSSLSLRDFADALRAALPRGRHHHDEGELLVLDCPDLALRRKGWRLSLTRNAKHSSLSLRQLARQTSLSAPATAHAPHAVHDIRASRLKASLEKMLGDAPLTIVQRWHTSGLRCDCLNDDDKIECTLVANQYRATAADASAGPLLIELIPKRGYERETASLAGHLQLPWRALDTDLLCVLEDQQRANLGKQACAPPRAPHATAATAVARVLLDHHATMCASAAPGGHAPGREALHDLRVATRHTRSLLRAFRGALGDRLEDHFSAEFRWLARATSRLRDLDVLIHALREAGADYAAVSAADRSSIITLLERERTRDAAGLRGVLASKRYARLRRAWPAALAAVIDHPARHAPPIEVAAARAIHQALARLRRDHALVVDDYSPAALHALRKQCKRLRYLVEPCASLYPGPGIAAAQAELKRLQTMMGEICDRHAQLALFKDVLRRRTCGDAVLRAALKRTRAEVRRRLTAGDVEAVLTALAEFDASGHHAVLDALFQTAQA